MIIIIDIIISCSSNAVEVAYLGHHMYYHQFHRYYHKWNNNTLQLQWYTNTNNDNADNHRHTTNNINHDNESKENYYEKKKE